MIDHTRARKQQLSVNSVKSGRHGGACVCYCVPPTKRSTGRLGDVTERNRSRGELNAYLRAPPASLDWEEEAGLTASRNTDAILTSINVINVRKILKTLKYTNTASLSDDFSHFSKSYVLSFHLNLFSE